MRTALEAILASRDFVFRFEERPADAEPGADYRITDFDLASRLSFFLWAAPPDGELIAGATRGSCGRRGARAAGAADARRSALRGARDALRRAVAAPAGSREDPSRTLCTIPDFDEQLADAMRRETELLLRDTSSARTASVLELFTADYTFVNERLAQPLRDSERRRHRVPARRANGRAAPRAAWPWQRADADVAWPIARRPCCAASG